MSSTTLRVGSVFCGLCCLGAGAAEAYQRNRGPLPALGGSAQGPVAAADIDVIENLGQRVPKGLVFSDGRGGKVSLDARLASGKPVLVTMGYYHCPMLCNLVHAGLAKAVKASGLKVGRDFLGLAVSVDPKEDPKSANTQQGQLLRAIEHEQRDDWAFTFDRSKDMAAARALAQSVGFRYKYDPASQQFAHAAVAFVLAPDGRIARYLYGVDFAPRDLRFALVEAGSGSVGTSLDRVLLSCFRYDPLARRYTPYAAAFIRIGAFLSFLALAGLLAVLWRRELQMRRRRPA